MVLLMPFSVALGLVMGDVISWHLARNNVVMVNHTAPVVKNDSVASVKLTEGYDVRVQSTMPAYSLNLAVFDNYKLTSTVGLNSDYRELEGLLWLK